MQRTAPHSAGRRQGVLVQGALMAVVALFAYRAGHWRGAQDAAAALPAAPATPAGSGGGAAAQEKQDFVYAPPGGQVDEEEAAAAAAWAAAQRKAGGAKETCTDQVDFRYDVAAHATPDRGPKGWPPPARRPGFKPVENTNQKLYDSMWTSTGHAYQQFSCWGCRFVMDVIQRLDFDTVLDAGTGNGQIVRVMRLRGKGAWGIELSRAVLERDAPDLLAQGLVEQGSLTNLPYQDSQFDLVFSADVLEHIRPEEAETVISELVRVARRHIVVSISLKSWMNDNLHSLLRPRSWWEAKFEAAGARVNQPLVWALQQKEIRFSREAGQYRECRWEGDEADGGKFEVCVVDTPWLVGRPGQELRPNRCITPANAEMEPWMFAFTVDKDKKGGGKKQG